MRIDRKTTRTELKFVDTGRSVMAFAGYASKFGGVDSYKDTILPGAFAECLKRDGWSVLMRRNHFEGVIGKWTQVEEDDTGLYVEGELTPGHTLAEDTYALLKHGAISGLSIGFCPVESQQIQIGGLSVRALSKIDLFEISVVDSPADLGATISDIKSAETLASIEDCLRSRGFSRAEATVIVAQIKRLTHGERAENEGKIAEMLRNYQII